MLRGERTPKEPIHVVTMGLDRADPTVEILTCAVGTARGRQGPRNVMVALCEDSAGISNGEVMWALL